jgi:alkylation response protein AidB-like acyl-CoA dehydrogenase
LGWQGVLVERHDNTVIDTAVIDNAVIDNAMINTPADQLLPGFAAAVQVHIECGRALANTGLLGHHAVLAALARRTDDDIVARAMRELADGDIRGVFVPAVPHRRDDQWGVHVDERPAAPLGAVPAAAGTGPVRPVTGRITLVPDLTENARLLVPVRLDDGTLAAALVDANADGVTITPDRHYDMSTPIGSVQLQGAPAQILPLTEADLRRGWDVMQVLLAAQALGVCEATLDMGVAYAGQRKAFGRPIGAFQAIKHQLVEVFRHADNVRSLLCFAAVSAAAGDDEFTLACACARLAGDRAAQEATRTCIGVHGAIAVTWEHDAHLYYRRAELARLLLGGEAVAAEHIAAESSAAASVPVPAGRDRVGEPAREES